ncbi:MAG: DUF2100 domain-containing protein [Promethearchaeota archaeon]|nr:MAG: DUF2100 domain-containing protein [Candidatus Lokiarchaeota archaeon]
MKNRKLSEDDIDNISQIIEDSFQLKTIIRDTSPFHELDSSNLDIIQNTLVNLNQNLITLSESLNITLDEVKPPLDLNEIFQGIIISTSKSLSKNLINNGLNKDNLIMISSPLSLEDFLKVNPKLPKSQFENFKTQIKKNWDNIHETVKNCGEKKFYFVKIEDNLANKLIKDKLAPFFEEKNINLDILDESNFD